MLFQIACAEQNLKRVNYEEVRSIYNDALDSAKQGFDYKLQSRILKGAVEFFVGEDKGILAAFIIMNCTIQGTYHLAALYMFKTR